ncbi:MAG: hypothetical protein ACK55I_51080, partial [bacterium]
TERPIVIKVDVRIRRSLGLLFCHDCKREITHRADFFSSERFGSGDEGWTMLTRQMPFESSPASVLFACGSHLDVAGFAILVISSISQ